MIPEKILYTDGHEVTVTDSFFKVKKSYYELRGITKHGFFIIHPDRLIPYFILMVGGIMIALGASQMMPENVMRSVQFYTVELTIDAVALGLGIVLTILAVLLLVLTKDRYAIWIATAEGEKNVVVSSKREYIKQILDALNHAFLNLISPTRQQPKAAK